MKDWRVLHGDCFELLQTFDADSIDAGVTDPPYGIGFMGKEWDTFKPEAMKECDRFHQVDRSRVNHPNPNLRNRARSPALSPSQIDYDRSLAGLRRYQEWCEAWATELLRVLKPGAHLVVCGAPRSYHRMACGIEDAGFEIRDGLQWIFGQGFPKSLNCGNGRGTALKPGYEPIVLARKPCAGSVTRNVQQHGTGALNVDACRIDGVTDEGRWPANVLLDEAAAAMLDDQSGECGGGPSRGERSGKAAGIYGAFTGGGVKPTYEDTGGASRFYYVAKPSRDERDFGIYDLEPRQRDESRKPGNPGGDNPRNRGLQPRGNFHPTVKPVELMRWLVRLVTPPDGVVLDPFTGSGTTGMAARYEHRSFIGIEREADYVVIAKRRIDFVAPLFSDQESA